ncbi:hypothetical protein QBC36DRAFT_381385 [Triangularia setosa]|uniref:Uncharacterized protein n=1 Tax=Triangularia setosa TaxID=2587417 RepID=A0AAN6W275_9PEZI|nr:hypothetical protein QBC36DRAFT_381385 [Podospora setosa]
MRKKSASDFGTARIEKCDHFDEARSSLALRDTKLPLDDDRYSRPIIVTGRAQLPRKEEQGSRKYAAKVYDSVYYPIFLIDTFVYNSAEEDLSTDCATRADRDYAIESAACSLINEAAREHPEVGKGMLNFYGSWTVDLSCPQSKEGYRPVRMISLGKFDNAQPMSKLIREWWCDIKHSNIHPHDVLVRKDGTVAIIHFQEALLGPTQRTVLFVVAKMVEGHHSPIVRHRPCTIRGLVSSWKVIGAAECGPEKLENIWAEWVPKAWLDDSDLAAIWRMQTHSGDNRYDRSGQKDHGDKRHYDEEEDQVGEEDYDERFRAL